MIPEDFQVEMVNVTQVQFHCPMIARCDLVL